jgi:hypothetical protein
VRSAHIDGAVALRNGRGRGERTARLCEEHVAYQWLCGGVGMNAKTNAKTLADFRVGHGALGMGR